MMNLSVLSISASASGSLADPAGTNALGAAALWLQGTLLGTIATLIAIIAVASVGLMTLTGRVNLRHGMTVIIGCFILFGASSIVAGMLAMIGLYQPTATHRFERTSVLPPAKSPAPPPSTYDPYAGAAVPDRR